MGKRAHTALAVLLASWLCGTSTALL